MAETLLTFDELARALNCSPATIRRHLCEIPHIRIGRVVRFKSGDVLDSLRNRSDYAKIVATS